MAIEFIEKLDRTAAAFNLSLSAGQLRIFQKYQEILEAANKTTNLTAVPVEKYIDEHFVDSLTLFLTGKFAPGQKIADIGAGAGFPGIPIKIFLPEIELHLIEANRKKADFLQKLTAALDLQKVFIHCARAEEVGRQPQFREEMDVVVARAVASLPVLLEYALPLCRVSGWFLAMKGPRLDEETQAAKRAALELGGRIDSIFSPNERLEVSTLKRVIVLIQKEKITGARYPRRPGVPAKRPLGG